MTQANSSKPLILIAGMHRGGTSMLAEVLHRCGLPVAAELVPDEPKVNQRGFWEDRRMVQINEDLLLALGSSWFDCRPLPPDWLSRPEVTARLDEAVSHLAESYGVGAADSDFPGLAKDPRLCRLLPFWLEACSQAGLSPRVVIVLRSPEAVADSLLRRDSLPRVYGMQLWLANYQALLRATQALDITLIDYDDFLDAPEQQLEQLLQSLQLDIDSRAALESGAVDPALRHSKPSDSEVQQRSDAISHEAFALYEQLGTGQRSPGGRESTGPEKDRLIFELATALVEKSGQSVAIGDQHDHALRTLSLRDEQIQKLTGELDQTRATVDERDRQLKELADLYEHAEKIVTERDAQLAQRNHDYQELEKLFFHAEQVVQQRDQRLARLNARLIGRLALRITEQKE